MAENRDQKDSIVDFALGRPVLGMAVAMITGIIIASRFHIPWYYYFTPFMVSGLLAAWFKIRVSPRPAYVMLLIATTALGSTLFIRAEHPALPLDHIVNYADKGKVKIEGSITGPVSYGPDRITLQISVQKLILDHGAFMPVTGRVKVSVKFKNTPDLNPGDRVRFTAPLRRIYSNTTPGTFDWGAYNRRRGLLVSASVRNMNQISMVEPNKHGFRKAENDIRGKIRYLLYSRLPYPENTLIATILLGERSSLPAEVTDTFKKGGVAHLLAISGMHIGSIFFIIYLITVRLLRFSSWACRRLNIFKTGALVALIPALAYAELAGWRISTTRAFIMVAMYALAILIGRQRDLLTAIAAAAVLILVFWPYTLLEPAFQLSFTAVMALAVIVPSLIRFEYPTSEFGELEKPPVWKRLLHWLKMSLVVSLGASIFTMPITAFHFGTISPYAVLGNLVMVPLYTLVVVPACLLAAVFVPVSHDLALAVFKLAVYFIDFGYSFTSMVAAIPGSLIWMGRPILWEIVAFYTAILSIPFLSKNWAKAILIGSMAVLIAIPTYISYTRDNRDTLEVTVIDVGQGQSQLIEFPGGDVWLVDGGGAYNPKYDPGRNVVGPFLRYKRIDKIDRIVNSHPHPDHFAGIDHVLQTFDVGRISLTDLTWDEDDRYEDLKETAKTYLDDRIQIVSSATKTTQVGPARVKWLSPPPEAYKGEGKYSDWTVNDRSMVLKIEYGDCAFLITSDIEQRGEEYLLKEGIDLRAQIMTVPHHGSRTSSSPGILAAIRPYTAIVSVGRYNWYGLPAGSVVNRYENMGIDLYRTDTMGTVKAVCDGSDWIVSTYGDPYPQNSLPPE